MLREELNNGHYCYTKQYIPGHPREVDILSLGLCQILTKLTNKFGKLQDILQDMRQNGQMKKKCSINQ